MGQTRGAQSGEADRHAVWLAANNLEPKLSPFDPFAILDEIQRLVPGYDLPARALWPATQPMSKRRCVQIETASASAGARRDLVLPAGDTLFTSGTLGRYSTMLHSVMESQTTEPAATAAD